MFDANRYEYSDDYVSVKSPYKPNLINEIKEKNGFHFFESLDKLLRNEINGNSNGNFGLRYKNIFIRDISNEIKLKNWVDIEEKYYAELIKCHEGEKDDLIEKLNKEFYELQTLLENYLFEEQSKKTISRNAKISDSIYSPLCHGDFIGKLGEDDTLKNILFLNFNYTSTLELYTDNNFTKTQVINIHGKLKVSDNPIIFGYGDELDEQYSIIEKKNNNDFFTNIKSFKYSMTDNYKDMLRFIDSDKYQVFVMGHSCGLSDRTLLNTLFEHEHCKSIKIFFYIDKNGNDNYNETYMNLSRNFKKKQKMRKIVVSRTSSISCF